MSRDNSKTYCPLPFLQYSSFNDSYFRLCCSAYEPEERIYTKGVPVDQTFNSSYMREVRRDLHNGIARPECNACYKVEARGGGSDRKTSLHELGEDSRALVEESVRNDYLVKAPQILDLRVGNVCNLRCQSCFADLSTGVAQERRAMAAVPGSNFRAHSHSDRLPAGFVPEQISPVLDGVKMLRLIGGEPMLSPEFKKLVQEVLQRDLAQNMQLKFHTNLTVLDEQLVRSLKEFEYVNLSFSVDGFGPMQEYLRYPSSWPKALLNLQTYMNCLSDARHVQLGFAVVIQATNLTSLVPLLEFTLKMNSEYRNGFRTRPILLVDPDYLNPGILPDFIKDLARQRMTDFAATLTVADRELLKTFYSDFHAALEGQEDLALLGRYIQTTEEYDRTRRTDVRTVFPEFQLIKDYVKAQTTELRLADR